jgi:hypothetical protein
VALSEQRLSQLNARAADIEERLRGKETELAQTRAQFQQLTADFRYNLKLLEDRDAELERLDGAVVTHRAAAEKAEQALAAARATVNEKDAELRRQKARVGELEAYHAEKVDRLRKQTDEARYTRDDALQRQKDDFANLERALVRQLEEQKAALETERREALEETERLRLKQSTELEVPLNDLRRELSDEKAQTLALAAELEAWRLREENTRGELSKSETKRRAAEQNAVAVYEKLAETENTVGVLRAEVAELRAFKDLAPEEMERKALEARRDAETEARSQRDEEFKTREREADRLRARVETLEEALRLSRRREKKGGEINLNPEEDRGYRRRSTSPSPPRRQGSASKGSSRGGSSGRRGEREKGRRVTIRTDSPSDGSASSASSSDADTESDSPPRSRRSRGGGDKSSSAPPSIGKEKPEAVAAANAAAAAIAEMTHRTRVRDLARRGDDPNAVPSSSQIERMWSALPPRAPAAAHVAISRAEIEKAAAAAVEAALASRMLAPSVEAVAGASAEAVPDAAAAAADETSPRTKLANAKRAVEVSSASAVKAARKGTSAGKKKRASAKPRPRDVFSGFRPSAFSQSSPTNGTFGKKKRAPSSLAAVEAREARLLAELEGKVAALSSGRVRSGRSAIRKALR